MYVLLICVLLSVTCVFLYIETMSVSRSTCLVLGAFLGIVAVYVTPSLMFNDPDDKKKNKERNSEHKPTVVVDPDDKTEKNESNSKLYGEVTILNCLEKLEAKILKIFDADNWKIIFPDVPKDGSDSSSIFQDAQSHFTSNDYNANIPAQLSIEQVDFEDDVTEYYPLDTVSLEPSVKKRKIKRKFHQLCEEIRRSSRSKDDHDLPRQSTLIDSKSINDPKVIPLWENTVNELENLAEDSKLNSNGIIRNDSNIFSCIKIRRTSRAKDDSNSKNLRRQSTLINPKSKTVPRIVSLGTNTIEELQILADNSESKSETVEDTVVLNFGKSKSPLQRIFRNVRNLLRIKKTSREENEPAGIKTNEENNNNNNDNNHT